MPFDNINIPTGRYINKIKNCAVQSRSNQAEDYRHLKKEVNRLHKDLSTNDRIDPIINLNRMPF